MKLGAWEIAKAQLCAGCVAIMSEEYIIREHAPWWLPGTCERCGKKRLVGTYKYTLSKKGLERRGLEKGPEK